ncbi:MAG TPA: dinucleotide-utilizing enzyme [Microbacterium sp.]|nr:dinucleotide-utilizing enzyme [Microbacterium sp.]
MSTTRLSRSIPFWVLVGGSVVAIAGGAFLLISKLNTMATTLTDGTATGVEVYAGQIWAVSGAILAGAGFVGLALALTLGALRSVVAPAADVVTVVEPVAWEEEVVEVASVAPVVPVAEPVVETTVTDTVASDALRSDTPRA